MKYLNLVPALSHARMENDANKLVRIEISANYFCYLPQFPYVLKPELGFLLIEVGAQRT